MKFHERFDIEVDLPEAQRRFVNRVYNKVYYSFLLSRRDDDRYHILKGVASALGDKYEYHQSFDDLVGVDFLRNLQFVEALFACLWYGHQQVNSLVQDLLTESEVDLGIEWQSGRFLRKGARLLDKIAVNDPLHWLRSEGYESVLKPFEKGLVDLLSATGKPDRFSDVVTDMYESVEALAKLKTGRSSKDLSANREAFISSVGASAEYKTLLSDYIAYANKFRHAVVEGGAKPLISEREAESFVYLTGVFLRLAMPG